MTFIINIGRYGGFYIERGHNWRICLGWIALTVFFQDEAITKLLQDSAFLEAARTLGVDLSNSESLFLLRGVQKFQVGMASKGKPVKLVVKGGVVFAVPEGETQGIAIGTILPPQANDREYYP